MAEPVDVLAERAAIKRGWMGFVPRLSTYRKAWQRGYAAGYLGQANENPYQLPQHQDAFDRGWQAGYEDQA